MIPTVKANGADIPVIGLGTWQLNGAGARRAIETALDVGYRHIDTAAMYDNESDVGAGLKASPVPREDVFVTTKVWPDNIGDGPLQRSAEASLRRLGLDYVDLLLIHWPNAEIPLKDSIRALCEVKTRGLARHIGVSNFPVKLIEEAVQLASEPIATNQIEYHVFLDQAKIIAACRKHGIAVTAYCPLARGRVFESEVLKEIAEAKGRTVSQVATRWLVQQAGVIAIPRSAKPERIKQNIEVFDFELTDADLKRIAAVSDRRERIVNLGFAPAWD